MLTDELLAHAEHDIRKIGQEVNAETLAARITHQGRDIYQEDSRDHELYARFMHEGIFVLYHYFRGEFSYRMSGSAKIFWFNIDNKMPHYSRENNPDIYNKNHALPYQMRVMYNTFSKHGLFSYYNDKSVPKGNLGAEMDKRDSRYTKWATVDTTKKDDFSPSYGFRPAAHSRVFNGGK